MAIAKYRNQAHPGIWFLTDFTMEQVEKLINSQQEIIRGLDPSKSSVIICSQKGAHMNQSSLSSLVPQVSADLAITKDDMIAIVVAKYEADLLTRRKELETKIRQLNKDLAYQQKEQERHATNLTNLGRQEPLEIICKQLKQLGFDKKICHRLAFDLTFSKDNRLKMSVKMTISDGQGFHPAMESSDTFYLDERPEPAAKEILEIDKILHKISDSISVESEKLAEVRRDLAQLATKERQAKAALAMNVLSQTDEGRAIIERLKNNDMKLLDQSF